MCTLILARTGTSYSALIELYRGDYQCLTLIFCWLVLCPSDILLDRTCFDRFEAVGMNQQDVASKKNSLSMMP